MADGVTQLSHYLLAHPSLAGALRTGLLLIMVWLLWAYTTWVTNWLDPERIAVRLPLLGLAGASLVMSAAWPGAFGARGLAVGGVGPFLAGHTAFTAVIWRPGIRIWPTLRDDHPLCSRPRPCRSHDQGA